MHENRIEKLEAAFAERLGRGGWMGSFIDVHVAIQPSGQCRISWSGPQRVQLEAPAGAACTSDSSGQIRCFEQDLRSPDAQRIPAALLFRRARAKIMLAAAAALDDGGSISADDLQLRRELDDERATSSEDERRELLELGISPDELEKAFEVAE